MINTFGSDSYNLFDYRNGASYLPPNSVIYIVNPEDPALNPQLSLDQIFDGFCL